MADTPINFFYEEVDRPIPEPEEKRNWISKIISAEGYRIEVLNFVLCSDEYLYNINHDRLNHDHYTDIITFDQSEEDRLIEGDVFLSTERIAENARNLGVSYHEELARVMIHGVLHLMGYDDKEPEQQKRMREKEDSCLSLYSF